jgi:hypothetical protein
MFLSSASPVVLTTGWWHREQVAVLHWKNLVKAGILAGKVPERSGV